MSDLLDIYTDLSSFSLANEIINDVGNSVSTCEGFNVGENILIKHDNPYSYYVYFGIIFFIGFFIFVIYKFYFSKKQLVNANIEERPNILENDIENNIENNHNDLNNLANLANFD